MLGREVDSGRTGIFNLKRNGLERAFVIGNPDLRHREEIEKTRSRQRIGDVRQQTQRWLKISQSLSNVTIREQSKKAVRLTNEERLFRCRTCFASNHGQ